MNCLLRPICNCSAPTGRHKEAQGNALGTGRQSKSAPTGRNKYCAPLGLGKYPSAHPVRCTGLSYYAPLGLSSYANLSNCSRHHCRQIRLTDDRQTWQANKRLDGWLARGCLSQPFVSAPSLCASGVNGMACLRPAIVSPLACSLGTSLALSHSATVEDF